MRIDLDLADEIYYELQKDAEGKGITVEDLIRFRLGELVDGSALNLEGITRLFLPKQRESPGPGMSCSSCGQPVSPDSIARGSCVHCGGVAFA